MRRGQRTFLSDNREDRHGCTKLDLRDVIIASAKFDSILASVAHVTAACMCACMYARE